MARWTGIKRRDDGSGWVDVYWETTDLTKRKPRHVGMPEADLPNILKTLRIDFEERGEKYYTQAELDEQVSSAVESALTNSQIAPVTSIGFKSEFDSLKDRIDLLEEKVASPTFQLPASAYELSDEERLKHWGPTVLREAFKKAIPNYPDDEKDTRIFAEAVDEAGAYLLIDRDHPLRNSGLCKMASGMSHKLRDQAA